MPVGQSLDILPSRQIALVRQHVGMRLQKLPAGWGLREVPNLDDWQAGDVVLVERFGVPGALIAAGQAALLNTPRHHLIWSHCAIYVGNGQIVDALPGKTKGVKERSLSELTERRATAVLRLSVLGAFIAPQLGQRIADEALRLVHLPYSISSLANIAKTFLVSKVHRRTTIKPLPTTPPKRLYCSSLVVVAYRNGIGVPLDHDPLVVPCMPANLPLHADLWSQPVEWRKGF